MANHDPPELSPPDVFEPQLAARPDDLAHRVGALHWYSRPGPHADPSRLAQHTRALARWHPHTRAIVTFNLDLADRDLAWRTELLAWLERARTDHALAPAGLLANLADLRARWAVRRGPRHDADRWLRDDPDVEVDVPALARAAADYREALARPVAPDDEEAGFVRAWCARHLVETLLELGHWDAAVDAARAHRAATDRADDGTSQLRLGYALLRAGRDAEAAAAFDAADSAMMGAAWVCWHVQAHARLGHGQLALRRGDRAAAVAYLHLAAETPPCACMRREGLPLHLARALLAAGERESVAIHCDRVARLVAQEAPEVRALCEQTQDRPGDG